MSNQIHHISKINDTGSKSASLDQTHTANRSVVVLLATIALFVLTQLYMAIPLLTHVGQDFGSMNPESATFALATSFSLAYACGFLIWGPVSDQYGRRPVMLVGLIILSIATFACSFAPSLSWLAGLRILQGLAASSFAPIALAYLTEAVPVPHRATAIGTMSTSFLVAGIFGQVLAAWIALQWDWIWVFIATGGCLTVAIPLFAAMVKEPPRAIVDGHLGHRFVALGKIIIRPAVLLLSCAHITLLLSFVAMYTALGSHLWMLNIAPDKVILLRLIGLPGMFAALLVGPLSTRFNMPIVSIIGYVTAASGLALEAMLSQSLIGIATSSLIFVTGIALAVPAMITQFGSIAAPNRGAGMALNGFILFIGASIGPLIATRIPSFITLLVGSVLMLLLAAFCVAGSALLTSSLKKP
ncbi:putative MFS family arabinose efflux permease [Xenorhabdus cabanillasii]|uniref:Putative MFS family arabinose efflux permease n=2 Tax=Xenorhabdus cabanillasii TaxID=351673 RepID=A0A3D9UDD5_9GAMM|nr:MFS transporter [Xenorhabdus cabanillasii]REF25930.1 putative MFS family arabinose efflux permease [Xenorhabdus cabanillasii]